MIVVVVVVVVVAVAVSVVVAEVILHCVQKKTPTHVFLYISEELGVLQI